MAAAGEERDVEERGEGDPLRRVVLGVLALYLAPVILAVLVIGVLGMACCAVLRLTGEVPRGSRGGAFRHGPVQTVPAPHIRAAVRSRSPYC